MIRYKQATGKSENTIADYRVTYKKLFYYFDSNPQIGAITRGEMIKFFVWLQEEYLAEPDGVAPRGKFKLSAKTVLNIHTNLPHSGAGPWKRGLQKPISFVQFSHRQFLIL
jgi:hypothetical protein